MSKKGAGTIQDELVAGVIQEISKQMSDPRFAELAVGTFISEQPDVAKYLSANAKNLGGAESVISTVFHAQVLAECFRRHQGKDLGHVGFRELDAVGKTPVEDLARCQPTLSDYLATNFDEPAARAILARVALAFNRSDL